MSRADILRQITIHTRDLVEADADDQEMVEGLVEALRGLLTSLLDDGTATRVLVAKGRPPARVLKGRKPR